LNREEFLISIMNHRTKPLPIEFRKAIELEDEYLSPLMSDVFAREMQTSETPSHEVLSNILNRVRASVREAADKTLARTNRIEPMTLTDGISARLLYQSESLSPPLGEPLRTYVLEFTQGAQWNIDQAQPNGTFIADNSVDREWLVLKGDLSIGGEQLTERDYKIVPRNFQSLSCQSQSGALVFVRETLLPQGLTDEPLTVFDAFNDWPEYAPGIRRRVLWQGQGQAAMLYLTEPLAEVPHHSHHHAEECFMVEGELYLDDVLLLEGDYQIAKGGSQHRVTRTDTGVVLFAHGDLDLRFIA
jgi:ChrR Cupin-like domain